MMSRDPEKVKAVTPICLGSNISKTDGDTDSVTVEHLQKIWCMQGPRVMNLRQQKYSLLEAEIFDDSYRRGDSAAIETDVRTNTDCLSLWFIDYHVQVI